MKTAYLTHILLWMLPVIAGQWLIGRQIFLVNLKPVFLPTLIIGAYLTVADSFAIRWGVWSFDAAQTIDFRIFGLVPFEECLFFFLASLLIAQSLVLFLPDHLRYPAR